MNSTLLGCTRLKSNLNAGQTRRAAGLLKTESKIMKLEIKFGEETRFDEPIQRIFRIRAKLWPVNRLSLLALAMAERSKPISRRID